MAGGDKLTINLKGWQKTGAMFIGAVALLGGLGFAFTQIPAIQGAITGDSPQPNNPQPDSPDQGQDNDTIGANEVRWSEYKNLVGLQFSDQTANEQVVFIADGVTAENYGDAQVTSIGADSDEQDSTELFASPEVEEGTDYYAYNTFGEAIKSGLPPADDYKIAVIGSGVVNQYEDVEIPETVRQFRVQQGAPIQPLSSMDLLPYAADSNVSVVSTNMYDGETGIAFDSNFTDDKDDTQVDGSVTGTRTYEIAGDTAAQFGEVSVSNVASQVDTVTVTVMADGEQVKEVSDSDFSDSEGLDDGVEFGAETAEDTVTVETYVEYSDSDLTSATNLVTSTLDDIDDDSSDESSFGITQLSTTWTGY
jgi:hypothetical protein